MDRGRRRTSRDRCGANRSCWRPQKQDPARGLSACPTGSKSILLQRIRYDYRFRSYESQAKTGGNSWRTACGPGSNSRAHCPLVHWSLAEPVHRQEPPATSSQFHPGASLGTIIAKEGERGKREGGEEKRRFRGEYRSLCLSHVQEPEGVRVCAAFPEAVHARKSWEEPGMGASAACGGRKAGPSPQAFWSWLASSA